VSTGTLHQEFVVHVNPRRRLGAPLAASVSNPPKLESGIMKNLLKRLVVEDKGQDVIEYALLAAGIGIVLIPTVPVIGTTLNAVYLNISGQVGALPGA